MNNFINDIKQAIHNLRLQGMPSYTRSPLSINDISCQYRGPNNTKCIVGQLINDEHYNRDLERSSCVAYPVTLAITESLGYKLTAPQFDLLANLQQIHDGAALHHYWNSPEYDWNATIQKMYECIPKWNLA